MALKFSAPKHWRFPDEIRSVSNVNSDFFPIWLEGEAPSSKFNEFFEKHD